MRSFFDSSKELPIELAYMYNPKRHTLRFPLYVEPKLDGVRLLIVSLDDGVQVWSRNGKRVTHFEKLLEECKLPKGVIFDCELFVKDWNTSMSIYQRETLADKAVFWVFDGFTIDEYQQKKTPPLSERKERLKRWLSSISCRSHFKYMQHTIVNSMKELKQEYKRALALGLEGLMIKDPDSVYQFGKRTTHWLKLKEVDYVTCKIIGFIEGTGKNKGRLGALVLRHKNVTFHCGNGFTDEDREEFWKKRESLKGKCIEVLLVRSKQKKSKAIFPVYVRMRPDLKC